MNLRSSMKKWLLTKIQRKIGLFFSILMILILATAVYVYFRTSTNHSRRNIRRRLHDLVSIVALDIDVDLHKELIDPSQQDSKTYIKLKKKLQSIRDASSDIYFIYTMRYDEAKGIVFVVDAEENEADLAHLGDVYEEPSDFLLSNAADMNQPLVETDFYTDEWGTWLTGYAPFYDAAGNREGILGIDINADTVKKYEGQLMLVAVLMMIVAFPTVFFLGWYFGREIAKPIVRIANTSSRIANGDLSLKVAENSPDEIGLLGRSFNKMTIQLNELISNLEDKVQERTAELSREIEERKKVEQRLIISERNYNAIMHDPSTFIGTTTPDGKLISANSAALNFIDRELADVKNKKFWDTPWWEHSAELQQKLKQSIEQAANGDRIHFEAEHKGAEGRTVYVDFSVRPVQDEVGNITSLIVEGLNITKLKEAENKVYKLLKEKELLLREVHHRIKNNMATIISLLHLHSHQIKSDDAKAALQDAIGRIKSMKILYDKLFRTDNFKAVNSESYLIPLIKEIVSVFPQSDKVKIINMVESFPINAKLVFPLGIIINELIANIMKYAFNDSDDNQIRVEAVKTNGQARLVIEDNGIGFNAEEADKSDGFGMQLITMMIDQIGGKLKIETENGTRFILKFSINSIEKD